MRAGSADTPCRRAIERLASLQGPAGDWEGEVVWCPVITAQVVIAYRLMELPYPARRQRLVLRHFALTQHHDGGWGLHPASEPYRFVTTLVYVAARLLGEPSDSPMLKAAQAWLATAPDGAYALPSWGKFWLFLLGLCGRDELNPCPPELFLLPEWVPFAPNRLYCHTRYIYLGMAALAGGPQADLGPLGASLRAELSLDGPKPVRHRHMLASTDAYIRPGLSLRLAYGAMRVCGPAWRRLPGTRALHQRARARCLERIGAVQRASNHQSLSPVNGVLNAIALWQSGSPEAAASVAGLDAWAWEDEAGGLRYAGARSTTWDTAFAVQVLLAGGRTEANAAPALRRAHRRLLDMQATEELPGGTDTGRQAILGGWCFSDGMHRWPVSDCTAEALAAILLCEGEADLIPARDRLPQARIDQAVDFLLARQNRDGGFGTYERRRGSRFLERLNPSEMFGQCMTELSYIECTASALRALCHVMAVGGRRATEVSGAARRAQDFLLRQQRPDGAWPGFWGINFVYGTMFAVSALREAGLSPEHDALRRAASWLRFIQHPDGGWGEHHLGCLQGRYVAAPASLVITTSWAVLALASAEPAPSAVARRGVAWLAARQDAHGDWKRDSVNGVFFGTAMLDYRLYNTLFPTWALARTAAHDA